MQITKITIWKSFRTCFNPKAVDFCKAVFMGESNTVEEKASTDLDYVVGEDTHSCTHAHTRALLTSAKAREE